MRRSRSPRPIHRPCDGCAERLTAQFAESGVIIEVHAVWSPELAERDIVKMACPHKRRYFVVIISSPSSPAW